MVLPHEVLGVPADADLPTIKRVFRTLAKEWHPDRNRDPRADERFRELVGAYRSLVRDHTRHQRSPRVGNEPPASAASQPVTATVSVDYGDDVSWVQRPAMEMAIAYPARLARIVVLGTLGAVALLWISALLSQL